MTVLDAIIHSLSRAGEYNRDDRVAPAVILWPDEERQWEPVLPVLRGPLPQPLTLGALFGTFNIFVRWKPLEQQPIGWHPGLNDGVRLNIRPFMEADLSGAVPAGRQGQAGVLRKRPNIKWRKDRGKNPPGSPWGEERHNDRHLTLDEKRKSREAKVGAGRPAS